MVEVKNLSTEKHNKESIGIEHNSVLEILQKINNEDKKVAYEVEKALSSVEKLINAILEIDNENTRIIYVGAGTSGRLGVVDASECPPTFGTDPNDFIGLIAGGNSAMFKAVESAEDNEKQGEIDLKNLNITSDDVVIGIAASGRTPYVVGALEYANSIGCVTGSICNSREAKISQIAKYPIEVVVGPEIVTGSTRMKSGTAQKMVLNMISTTIMIKRGKVLSGYMIDVKTTNEKLIERAKQIIVNTTGCDYELASNKLQEANMDVKVAILMILLNITKDEAINKLKENKNVAMLINKNKEN